MIAGFTGHLVSPSFLNAHLAGALPASAAALSAQLAAWRRNSAPLGPASSVRALIDTGADPLLRLLGFTGVEHLSEVKDAIVASVIGGSRPALLLVAIWGQRLDPLWRPAIVEARRRDAEWCVLFNGTHLRLVDARRVHSRRYAEIDLDAAAEHERSAAALWTLCGAGALSGAGGESPLSALIAASERYGAGVCRSLRDGVLSAATDVLEALITGLKFPAHGPLQEPFEQALTIVYRVLFLLFAEARGLVPVWHRVYRESYSVETLRRSAETAKVVGFWDALRAISRLAHAGCHAGDLRVTPFNGRLFAPARTPLAERRGLDDAAARRAVLALATRRAPDGTAREPIAYRDLGVEQLGAVYETLLDYEPTATRATRQVRPVVSLRRGSGRRKATGTFYTPQPIAEYLVRRTLGPLVHDASPERILSLKVVDPAMGSGAFLVAACHYLAHAYEAALIRAGGCLAADFGPAEQASIRRLVAERCLYGVDLNPMAVQLARLSLWLTTLASDRPLTFLDHHLQSGDSLLGAWISDLNHPPRGRRRRRDPTTLPLFDISTLDAALRDALPVRFTLASMPDDTIEQIRTKERALATLVRRDAALSKWKQVADLWCSLWFWTDGAPPASAFAELSDRILTSRSVLPEATADRYITAAETIAVSRRFFHWELEFPEVFFEGDGRRLPRAGFDAVIGNPPWDMIRADSGSPDGRSELRADAGAILRFTRDSGIYRAQSDGHPNRYQLFLERAMMLACGGGRLGIVLPAGMAVDHGSARLRRRLFAECAVDAVVGFDNRLGVFPIHRSVRFMLLTATAGSPTRAMHCRLGESDPSVLEQVGDDDVGWYRICVAPETLTRLTGDDLALPDLAREIDLAIADRAASLFPPLGEEHGWCARFGRELNATDDRQSLRPAGRGLPIVEGRQIVPFQALLDVSRWSIAEREADRLLGGRHRRARLAYRDVASATNRQTLIAALLPSGVVSTHTVFCLRTSLPLRIQHFLCGLFNSFVVNYLVRLRVTTHVTTAIVERLPVPRADRSPRAREIAALARWLASTSRNDGERARAARARLNARVAELYELTLEEFAHVLATFPLVPEGERDRAMGEFQKRRV